MVRLVWLLMVEITPLLRDLLVRAPRRSILLGLVISLRAVLVSILHETLDQGPVTLVALLHFLDEIL